MTSNECGVSEKGSFDELLAAAMRDGYRNEEPSDRVRAAMLREAAAGQARAARLAKASASLKDDRPAPRAGRDAWSARADRRRGVEAMHAQLLRLRFVL